MVGVVVAFLIAGWAEAAGAILALAACAVVIDAAVQTNQILSLRAIYALAAEARGRLNAVYVASIFCGGSAASALAAVTYEAGGWRLTSLVGAAFGVAALALFATEKRVAAISR
jgi:predicted MFS family arabinose efflux permease